MDVDFKITCWERMIVPDEYKDVVLEKLKSGEITTGNDLYEFLMQEEGNDRNLEFLTLKETENYLSLEQNQGYTTIEAILDGETIFENGK